MLQVENLRFGYGGKAVVKLPKLKLADGDQLLVRGASGSGKTTLLMLLAGLLAPDAGRVALDGVDVAALRGAARDDFRGKHIGFVFQQPHLMPALTVMQNILVAPFMAGVRATEADAAGLLAQVGLGELAGRYPAELSWGQQQRVGLARALIGNPKLVLADEPTSALDDAAAAAAMGLLQRSVAGLGAHLVVTSHDARITRNFKQVLQLEGQK